MEVLSNRIKALEESATLAMAAKARELKSQGVDIINLSLGEPDFKTPQYIQDGAIKAINSGNYFAYPPVAGYADLKQAIADKLNKENNIPCKAENIVVSAGAKQSIANAVMCLVNPGDEVIVFSPYWVSYAEIIKLAEGVPVLIQGTLENNFKATAEQLAAAITPKTKAVMYSSPCNPTGSVFSNDELRKMAAVLKQHKDIYVIADEIYEYINFSGEMMSMASLPEMYENTITVNGFSKGFAMTGWRVGYISAPVGIAKACEKMQGQITSGNCSIAQRAAYVALTERGDEIEKMAEAYRRRRDMVLELLKEIPGVKTYVPTGAFYIFPDIREYFGKSDGATTIKTADDLCLYILNKAFVSLVTGEAFGQPDCIRISFAASDEQLREAIKRIKEVLSNLK
jgi:aspartate aminotransferase